MMMRPLALLGLILAFTKPAFAEPPRVVTDIAPVHSLVSMVLQDIGEADLLMPPGVSPHDYALRPSDARNLNNANAVIWIGEALTPGLARSIRSLAGDATSLELLKAPGTNSLPFRTGAVFEAPDAHDHHTEHDHDDHGERDHAEHDGHGHQDHDEHTEHKDHADDAHDGHAHHGDSDPHAWQDPENAKVWLAAIAEALAQLDPANATAYRANAEASVQRIDAVTTRLKSDLHPIRNRGFVVTHDAFHHFENRFGVRAVAAISPGDATQASAARLKAVSREMKSDTPICIFIEPQMSEALARTFADEHGAKVGVLDPIGATYQQGADLYVRLLEGIASGLRDCLS